MPPSEGEDRHRIGVDKLMWGTDYPHLEGTWPNTLDALRRTFADYPEEEIAGLLGTVAALGEAVKTDETSDEIRPKDGLPIPDHDERVEIPPGN